MATDSENVEVSVDCSSRRHGGQKMKCLKLRYGDAFYLMVIIIIIIIIIIISVKEKSERTSLKQNIFKN